MHVNKQLYNNSYASNRNIILNEESQLSIPKFTFGNSLSKFQKII